MEQKRKFLFIITMAAFCLMAFCFGSQVYAKAGKGTVTQGTEKYRGFQVDNVYHSPKDGDIHYHSYFPESYDGKKKMALYVTLPGYQGLYFQGVAENLKTEDFAFQAKKYNKDMIILAPQLEDWEETSADQTVALVEYFLDNYPVNPARVYINGYSGGGETLSLVLAKRPELFAGALMCSSQWDGEYEPVTKAKTPVYFVIGEDDEYYSSKPFKDAYKKLHDIYQKQGMSEKEIGKLLVLDVKGESYFEGTGVTYQHGGGYLFCRDNEIMGWLFAQEKTSEKNTKYSLALNKSIYTLKKGKNVKLKANLNRAAKKKGVEWKVGNPKIASVSKTGKVTAKKKGKTVITAKVKVTKTKAGCRIIVGTPVSRIKLNKKSISLTTGQKFTLKATISPRRASMKRVTYQSGNGKVAMVSKKGVIRAVSAGTAKITVTAADGSGKKASCTVKVSENIVSVSSVALNKTRLNLKQGGKERLIATVNPSNATDQAVRWSSSNHAVAEVSNNGTVKAVADGTAIITASAHNNVRAVCSVTVESVFEQPTEPEKPTESEKPTEPEKPSVSRKVTKDTTVSEIINDPAFGDFGRLLFPVDRTITGGMTLKEISSSSVYTWYSNIKVEKTVEIVNDLKSRSEDGERIFYRIYSEEEMKADPKKRDTGLFYFKGKPGAKYAILNAGGGFVYVGAMHDSFPHALEISKKGYHAFALIYRPDSAYEDLARAIAYVNDHAKELGVDAEGYSLWGGSAGARMAATLGNVQYGPANYGRPDIPQAAAVIMQYTGYTDASANVAPTYACVGTRDGIADYRTMESRLAKLSSLGIPTEFHAYEGLGHGFGLGTGTVADGWIEDAVAFWEAQVSSQKAEEKNTLLTAAPTPDKQQVLYVWEEGKAPATTVYTQNNGSYFDDPDFRPYVTFYPAADGIPIKGAVVICAGGAFQFRSESEGPPVALELSRRGYQSFVLDYRLRPYTQEEGALDLARTVRFIRRHACEYGIDEKDIAVMGFSAGGILAGEMILHYGDRITPDALDPSYVPDVLDRVSAKVAADGMIYSFYGRLSVASMDLESLQEAGLPPTYYCYGTNDPFYRQFEAQFSMLENAGEPVERLVY